MDREGFQCTVRDLYSIVQTFESMFPGRPFTPDGHMVGSIGECLVAEAYALELLPPSNKGYDAVAKNGKRVEIKATQSNMVAFRSCPEHAIVIQIRKDGSFEECFNGPGEVIWKQLEGKPLPSNGQFQISIGKVNALGEHVPFSERIPRVQ